MKEKWYVEVSMIVEAWSEDQAESIGNSIAQRAIGHEDIREAWVNAVWYEENTQP